MDKQVRHICGLSGGKDSTALALYMRDRVPDMEYVFCDTGKELQETYDYLALVEAFLGKKIIYLNAKKGFDHWLDVYDNYLPSPKARWCTRLLKLKPYEEYIGDEPVISYVGIRADEDRTGLISGKPNLTTVFPFKEDGIDFDGVMRILSESGIGMPPYLSWGRTHSGCFFCFYQSKYEWVRLLEMYPDKFAEAEEYERRDQLTGTLFTWMDDMPITSLRDPKLQREIKEKYAKRQEWLKARKGNKRLIETLGGLEVEDTSSPNCLICHL